MTGIDSAETAENYRLFARLAFLEGLPPLKRQPNLLLLLLFAAARALLGEPATPEMLHELVRECAEALRDVMLMRCRPRGALPLPSRVPQVAWRAGIDLHPLDVTDDDDTAWLHCLVWPGEADRADRLVRAVTAARRYRPVIHAGDLLDDPHRVAADAPLEPRGWRGAPGSRRA
jgi:hypothetical protein